MQLMHSTSVPFPPPAETAASEIIGFSEEGRPIVAHFRGHYHASLRILIMAGQHGDERRAMRAVNKFLNRFDPISLNPVKLQIAAIACLNPDGYVRKTRLNSRGVDLNRDHQMLRSKEVYALHSFVRRWRPHFIIDVHNYPSRRQHLLQKNLVYGHDLFLDIPNNPNVVTPLAAPDLENFLDSVLNKLRHQGIFCDRYALLRKSGRLRFSTPDIEDARNGLALRYGIPTMLLESRQPTRMDDKKTRQHLHRALMATLESVVSIAAQWQQQFTRPRRNTFRPVVLKFRYCRAKEPAVFPFRDSENGVLKEVSIAKFTPALATVREGTLPLAYAVPARMITLRRFLDRQGFTRLLGSGSEYFPVEAYQIISLTPSKRENRAPRHIKTRVIRSHRKLSGYCIYPVTPQTGRVLAVFLEPESKFGLLRCSQMNLGTGQMSEYPVLRLVPGKIST